MPRPRPPRSAYTLIELLAVVMVLSLMAGLTVPTLARRAAGDPVDAAIARLLDEEARVRCLAVGRGASLELASDGFIAAFDVSADVAAGAADAAELPLHLGGLLTTSWSDHDQPVARLRIDRYGRSRDLVLAVDDGRTVRRYRLAGLSGEWSRLEEP